MSTPKYEKVTIAGLILRTLAEAGPMDGPHLNDNIGRKFINEDLVSLEEDGYIVWNNGPPVGLWSLTPKGWDVVNSTDFLSHWGGD